MPKFAKFTLTTCNITSEQVECTGYCSRCGWNPRVVQKRLKKRFTQEQIDMLSKAPIVLEENL